MPATYAVTPTMVSDRIQGFLLDANSRPTISTVEMIIDEQGARVAGYLRAKGLGDPMTAGGELVARSVVLDLVISYVERARSRSTTSLTDDAWERGRAALDQIYDTPASMGEPVGGRLSNMSAGAAGAMRAGRCDRRLTLLERMAREGRL